MFLGFFPVKKKALLHGFYMELPLTNIWIYLDDILRSFLWLAIGLSKMLQTVTVYNYNLLFSKAHAHVRLNALSAGLSPGSKKRLEAQAKIGTHSRFVRPCQASALLTWYTSDLWYTSLICAKAKMMDLTGNGNITTAKRARKPLKKP